MLLNNVELNWVKLDPKNPDMGFDKKSPQFSVVAKTTAKADAEAWKKAGINVKPVEENGSIVYQTTLKKKIYTDADGKMDKTYSGKYVISSIRHIYSGVYPEATLKTNLTLVRDSFGA